MKQILQDLRSGATRLEEVPVPIVQPGHVLIKTRRSLVSLGTERMLVQFGNANWLQKVQQQPEKVKQVLDKLKTDGIQPTVEAVFRKLDQPLPLGYCNAGEVVAVGTGVTEFSIGDRVASNGHHAEVVCIPQNLVAKIPDSVSDDEASFTVVGAIALQGIRLVEPTFGETVVVLGLGLIGLLTAQLLLANGCRVIGVDLDPDKLELARELGIEAIPASGGGGIVQTVIDLTAGVGADAVLITASSKRHDIIAQSAKMSRKRGRIVLVGVVGLHIDRSDFYEKELSFQVSCSYGPGRYDPEYELAGHDYPLPFVRWTEKRNFAAVLQAMERGSLRVKPLISETIPLEDYDRIYQNMDTTRSIGSVLEYPGTVRVERRQVRITEKEFHAGKPVIGLIGAGDFTVAKVLPILQKLDANIKYIASSRGMGGTINARKFGIPFSTTDYREILADAEVNAVIITTRHHQHAGQVTEALRAGKHVFVEKPLAITAVELEEIAAAYGQNSGSLSVGFNRRFAPLVRQARARLGDTATQPMQVLITMNAGAIPAEHWTQDPAIGGGRVIGEACHLIDLITYLTDSQVERVAMNGLGQAPDRYSDNVSMLLKYRNGSNGVINYFANGHRSYAKERIEIFSGGKVVIIDNFRKAAFYGMKGDRQPWFSKQDKGHYDQFRIFLENLKDTGEPTIPFDQILNTSRTTFAALDSLQTGQWIDVP
ncbi:bi-domain-containing oxidoreductase [Flavilitoribacter nigricans]|uniref:Dehydrogenase n=1 Tax=Flavilitoribacter nigricans (strain ATCC 23147 / DSM 23189 / NBRC 102662 / NCIMB 1420 / SS-2) TaxID=1122177 RepID=A0A2D0NK52_FLAN2|nr:bi-domain-containing oxidoreductase [Flavilitoribacter nigricans]PHN08589.1 dehydrogenase [Flavilitoribacter nigricans DSM 23189 = NBRC 102662]